MKNLTVRCLNKADLAAVAHLHAKAFSDRALAGLGKEAVKRYYAWQLTGPHDAVALGIFEDDVLAGFCFAGVFRGALSGFLKKNRAFLAWRVITQPWLLANPLFVERVKMARSILSKRVVSKAEAASPSHNRSFGVLAIAVDPRAQRAGHGYRLMQETERIAMERGFDHLHLTVATNNVQAIRFYEKLGWRKSPDDGPAWHGRMTKQLLDR